MKTTLEIPNELFRAAKSKAALDGRKLKDLVAEGLSLVLQTPTPQAAQHRARFLLIRSKESRVLTAKRVDSALEAESQEEAKQIAKSLRR
jgi:hypothetical protein